MMISGIEHLPRLQCVKNVQRFMGMLNCMSKFIPNLFEKMAPLRWLTEKKNWYHLQEAAWQHLKVILSKEPILKFYDPKCSIKISADASKTGVGAVLLQDYDGTWQPVAYASHWMTDADCRYAPIEKELLSITFECERFHFFISICGRTIC